MIVGRICSRPYLGAPKNPPPHWQPAPRQLKAEDGAKVPPCRAYVPVGQPCWKCGAPPDWCRDCKDTCRPEHRGKLEAQAAEYARAVAGLEVVP